MDNERLERQMSFALAIDNEKQVLRQTHLSPEFFERGGSDCHVEAFFQPIRVEAHADRWLYALVADGTPEELPKCLDAFDFAHAPELVREAETHFVTWLESPLRFSQERMAAVLLDEYRSGKLGRITLEIPEAKS